MDDNTFAAPSRNSISGRTKARLFLILFFPGFLGVASLLLIDWSAIAALIPAGKADIPTITPALKVLSLIQPTLLVAAAVLIGVALASRVGLSAPAAEALATGGNVLAALKPQLAPGLIGGSAGGICIVLLSLLARPFLTTHAVHRISEFAKLLPLPTRILYGGVAEELLLRWGFMTLLVWAGWRVLKKGQNIPPKAYFVGAILLSSLVFGIGHLPVALLLLPDDFSVALVLFVVLANSAFGVFAGYLYWKRGLESAMIAHVWCHLVLACASWAGAYF